MRAILLAALLLLGCPKPGCAASATQIGAAESSIELELGKGTLLRLKRPVATVFVANPDTADVQVKSPTLVYVFAKAPGETVLYAVDDQEQVLYNGTIRVTHNLTRLREALHGMLADEPIGVDSVNGGLVLSGNVSSAARAEEARAVAQSFADQNKYSSVINHMAVIAPNQVNLRVRIAEVDRNTLKEIGINWSSVLSAGRFAFGLVTANPVTISGNLVRNTANAGWSSGASSLEAMIDALGQEGLITVLAEPNLTALSGQTASFLAGGEFPIPIAETPQNGTTQITVEFKKYGVALEFTPTILDGNRINLRVRPEVSQLTTIGAVQLSGLTIPALTVRRTETTVELGSGESFAIAGLLENNSEQDLSKIPGMGDVPVLGALFRSDRYQRNETELAIIVTPYLVRPTGAVALLAPTDGYAAPSDARRLLAGGTYTPTSPAPARVAAPGLIGPAGLSVK